MRLWQVFYKGKPISAPYTEGKALKKYKELRRCFLNIDLRMITSYEKVG